MPFTKSTLVAFWSNFNVFFTSTFLGAIKIVTEADGRNHHAENRTPITIIKTIKITDNLLSVSRFTFGNLKIGRLIFLSGLLGF